MEFQNTLHYRISPKDPIHHSEYLQPVKDKDDELPVMNSPIHFEGLTLEILDDLPND